MCSLNSQVKWVTQKGNRNGVNKATDDINMIFHKALKRQNAACKTIRKDLRKIGNEKHSQPNNSALCIRYKEALNEYKHTIRNKKQNYTHMKLEDIESAINQNQFWDMWNNFNTKQPQALPIQNGDI